MPNNNRVMRRPLRRHPGQAPAPAGVPTAEGEGERGAGARPTVSRRGDLTPIGTVTY